ncbi:DPP IV N-terminal domain-containing protein, partial [Marisediminitalea aggregata]|uniref:DPP IV N-terminal domain-containing protein n=1 Tax=Marisediminitalea aggregata TaxID=634436 RepID=UPI0020CE3A5B
MPNHLTRSLIAGSLSLLLFACANTTESSTPIAPQSSATLPQPASVVVPDVATSKSNSELTLKQIMADPDWLGRQPSRPSWSLDGDIVYARKREGSVVDDYFLIEAGKTGNGEKIELSQAHQYRYDEKVSSNDEQYTAWRFEDSVFVKMPDGAVVQLTRGGQPLRDLTFMTDNRLMAKTGDSFILIQYIQVQRKNREDRFEHEAAMRTASPAVAPEPFYFPSGERLVAATLSPDGQHAIVVTTKQGSYRDKTDIMPHYIQEDGRIAAIDVRQRVADAKPVEETVWLVDLNAHSQHKLSYFNLPGYNDDVLADVKAENAAARGETYTVNRLPRAIGLLNSWYWSEPSVRWHQDGTAVALMLEAWDNKDRWIVTVDFDSKQFNTEHRLHDDAWVNYRYNQFGWLHNSHTLFYQSEHTGYSHLYVQTPGQAPRALTAGEYVVDEVTLTNDDQYVYFKANKKHPGIYEIYRVNVETGEHETLTELNGMTDYVLSPGEDALLLTHSKVTPPPELFLQTLTSGSTPV